MVSLSWSATATTPARRPIRGDQHGRPAGLLQPRHRLVGRVGVHTVGGEEPAVAEQHLATGHRGGHALAGYGVEAGRLGDYEPSAGRRFSDGGGQRVLGALLGRRRQQQHLVFPGAEGDDVGQLGPAPGQGARLVEEVREFPGEEGPSLRPQDR